MGQLAAAAAAFGMGVPGQDTADANFLDIIESRSVREKIVQSEFTFHAKASRFAPDLLRTQTLYDYFQAKNMDQAVRALGLLLSASRDIKTKILSITAETKSAELSRLIVQSAMTNLGTFVMEKGRTRGGEKAHFAGARLKESREELAQAQNGLLRFLEANRNYQVSADPSVRLQGLGLEAELKLRQQLVMTLAMNREQALLEEKNDIPIINVLDPANLPLEKSRPKRSLIVMTTFFLVFAVTWGLINGKWLLSRLGDVEGLGDEGIPNTGRKESK